jgi:RNA polymerase sigma-70 factor (ECF subfamily)
MSNESQLIAKVLIDNDQQAFSALVRHYQLPLRQYCRRLCAPDHALADDIAQEAMIQAFKKLSLYQGKAKLQSWLFRIAYFQFLQYLRKQKHHDELHDNIAMVDTREGVNNSKDLEWAITQLNEKERACITLHFSFGYTHDEISKILQLPLGTVKSHVKRGKDKLTHLLALNDKNLSGVA